jgi:hypothetical protein
MDCVRLRLLFDFRLDFDVKDLSLPGIVLVGLPVGSDEFASISVRRATRLTRYWDLLPTWTMRRLRPTPLHLFCLSVVLFTSDFRSTPPEQTLQAAAMLDKQQRFWNDRLLPGLPRLTRHSCARRPCQSRTVD